VKDKGPSGYSVDSNIVELGGCITRWYIVAVACGLLGQTGTHRCITPSGGGPMRTQNVFDPSSWRGWSGTDFSVSFVDPYPGPVERPLEHVIHRFRTWTL